MEKVKSNFCKSKDNKNYKFINKYEKANKINFKWFEKHFKKFKGLQFWVSKIWDYLMP